MVGRATPVRAAIVWVTATAAAGGLVGWLRPDLAVAAGPPATLGEALGQGAAVVAAACVGWLWLVTGLTVLEAVELGARPGLGCPVVLRRVVLAACGTALAAGVAGSAHAGEPVSSTPSDGPSAVVAGLPLPDRTFGRTLATTAPAAPAPPAAPLARAHEVVVAPGDSLWSIAAGLLPDTAPDHAVDSLWRRIYAANRLVIGDDPGLVRPGQLLRLPEAAR